MKRKTIGPSPFFVCALDSVKTYRLVLVPILCPYVCEDVVLVDRLICYIIFLFSSFHCFFFLACKYVGRRLNPHFFPVFVCVFVEEVSFPVDVSSSAGPRSSFSLPLYL
jgi:hypothetical protein